MQTHRKELYFEGQNIFLSINVNLKNWNVLI